MTQSRKAQEAKELVMAQALSAHFYCPKCQKSFPTGDIFSSHPCQPVKNNSAAGGGDSENGMTKTKSNNMAAMDWQMPISG